MERYETEEAGAGFAVALLGGMALGALAMYLADPEQGRRRRAIAQQAVRSVTERTGDAMGSAWRDASSRLTGWQESAHRLLGQRNAKPIDNHVLEARVRSKLSRVASNAHAIDVAADQGRVTLTGPVVAEEREAIMDLVQSIPGVESVRARLDAGEASMLPAFPGLPLLALAGGALVGYYGLTRRGNGGEVLRSGMQWLSRNLRGFEWASLLGAASAEAEPVSLERSIDIKATPDAVFDVWTHYENFPHFMSHVVEVRDLGRSRSHWIVRGPAGSEVEWHSRLIRFERPHVLAWESEPGAMVENSGSIWLERIPGGTRATVRMNYRPPAGMLGKTVALLSGTAPERVLEDDLVRMRDYIERGREMPGEAEAPARSKGQVLH